MTEPAVLSIFHFTVSATDFERSLAFYETIGFRVLRDNRDVIWPPTTAVGMGLDEAQGRGALLAIGDGEDHTRLDLIEWLKPRHRDRNLDIAPGHRIPRIIALRTRNVRGLYETLRSKGIEFTGPPRGPNPQGKVIAVATCRDPDGLLVEFIEYEPGVLGSRIGHLDRRSWQETLDFRAASEKENLDQPALFHFMNTQRAMRRLKPDPVPRAVLEKVLWAATRAPNGANRQPWRFVIVADESLKKAIQQLYLASFERNARGAIESALKLMPPDQAKPIERMFRSGEWLAQHLHEVPVIVFACLLPYDRTDLRVSGGSIFPAVQNLLLAARALGLGSCLTSVEDRNLPELRALLDIPEDVEVAAQIPLGWPAGRFGPVRRLPVEDVTFYDRWNRTDDHGT